MVTLIEIKDFILPRKALILVFLSGVGFSLQALVVKLLIDQYHFDGVFQILFLRGLVQLITNGLLIFYYGESGQPMFGGNWKTRGVLLARTGFGFMGISFGFLAVAR